MSNERENADHETDPRRQIHRNRIAAIIATAGQKLGYRTHDAGDLDLASVIEAAESQTVDSQAITETFRPAGYPATTGTPKILRKPLTRRATPQDWEGIWNLDQLCYPGDPWSRNEIRGKLIQSDLDPAQQSKFFRPTHFLVFANLIDQPIGYVAYRIFSGYARIDRLGVHPLTRKKGIGTILLEAMLAAIAEMNSLEAMMARIAWNARDAESFAAVNFLNAVETIVHERELPAQLFLRSNGFDCHNAIPTFVRKPSLLNPNEWGPWEAGDSIYSFIRILDENGDGT